MELEKELANALALVLLQNTKDQWGNEIVSPLSRAISEWAENNKEKIQTIILDKINKDEFTDIIADKITKDLSWLDNDWRKNYDKENLKSLIKEKVAKRIAEKVEI